MGWSTLTLLAQALMDYKLVLFRQTMAED